jgi:lipooligosaccharide transport system permease protein
LTRALFVLEHDVLAYRRTWKGSIFVSFVSPVLFLAAMGVGLGNLIARGPVHTVGGVSYVSFIAPGLLAITTMQTAFSMTAYPILNKMLWGRTYDAMLATPLTVGDLLAGEIGWIIVRQAIVAGAFFVIMTIFGTVHSVAATLAIPAAVLNGLAFGGPMLAFTATQRNDLGFTVIARFVITPLFILAGTFFPIGRLPSHIQTVAWVTPLAHGVALTRGLTVGGAATGVALHIAVLLAYTLVGFGVAGFALNRRLAT